MSTFTERLRLKIIERLLKEGSSADEPLNIPLSDYSSDEGDTSSSSDNEGKASLNISDLEGPCCAPLKAPPCSPEINPETRKRSKTKMRSKSWQMRNKPQRLAFDMPTTDPGSDLVFSTDDEFCAELTESSQPARSESYGTMPRARRLLQSELQRRYIEEFGGDHRLNHTKRMPPELIVTSPTKQCVYTSEKMPPATYPFPAKAMQPTYLPSTAPAQQEKTGGVFGEFPMIGAPTARRTSSWHNLNNNKSASKLRNSNPYAPMPDNSNREDLQFRLSLKKNIWTGVQQTNDSASNPQTLQRNRPLSWGMPPVGATAKREKSSALSRLTKRDDREALFTACSQKLLAWQQQTLTMPVLNPSGTGTITCTKSKGKFTLNLQTTENTEDERAMLSSNRFKHVPSNKIINQKTITRSTELMTNTTTESKAKKRKNPISKMSETTQLITRLAKTKSNTTVLATTTSQRRLKSANPSVNAMNTSNKAMNQSGNKFKTGGLVATATAQPRKQKKFRSLGIVELKSPGLIDAACMPKASDRTMGVITIDMQAPPAEAANPFVRKVKTKLRRKSKTAQAATSATAPISRKAN